MTTTTTRELDLAQAQAFAMKVLGDTTAMMMGTLHLIGDRLGLFESLAASSPVTHELFAERTGIHPRYAREWLAAMACHGYIAYDDTTREFSLTPEQAACLVNRNSPLFLGGLVRMQPDFWRNVDALTDTFQDGGGVSQDRFGDEWCCGMERFTHPAFANNLCRDWIPAMPEIDAGLREGGSVADVGCGNGQALIHLAQCYPNATLVGFDKFAPAIEHARAHAASAGLGDRIQFEVCDAEQGIPGAYDLITCFDVVHDLPRPVETLRAIRAALKPGGSFFVLEFNLSDDLQENIEHPLNMGAFGYAASLNYCMTTSLAAGGVGTGTCLGERGFRDLAAAAGFSEVRRLDFPTNPFNIFFEAKA